MRYIFQKTILFTATLALSLPGFSAPPKVLVSIKPLQMITAAITSGVTEPELLLQPGTSPHDYSMKPSDVRKIANADFVFWIGEDLERFLEKPLNRFSSASSVLAVMDAPGVKVRKLSEKEDKHGDEHAGHNAHEGHDHGNHDPHIWLEPDNALAIAKTITRSLQAGDKEHADIYQLNLYQFEEQLKAVNLKNQQILKPISDRGFFTFHDAWGYFTNHYNLKVAGVFTISPEIQPGARHIAEIRQKIKTEGNTCIFREPQFKPAYLDNVINGLNVRVAELDPLATYLPSDPMSYPRFLEAIALKISACLTTPAQ
ncbi:zinc ABC transporter substrate-binding protein ZnuA [Sansalvadorimonas sp. 2012CJ34-2]|uniref:High-affinity zinc uptake system protein ZnuA n=1 Tax=Parendozoicomonas callyspongiae TaxID=2942213 RepID=A0ABT0PB43_9GAMM|nr:zinc ABC transporter substrate-binding protein ZnuA [Sansalvadorimonas sp. 2012CJ34-2]MCL6268608.1 zinc ABC transporter substrate-binding protein ZnuA [Sansalvadorimonas sp. 2012CJ34-2]